MDYFKEIPLLDLAQVLVQMISSNIPFLKKYTGRLFVAW
jgi:hypothetical protein